MLGTFMRTRSLRLPQRLSFTALSVAIAGGLACSSGETRNAPDAAIDAREDGPAMADGGPGDACAAPMFDCIPYNSSNSAACPQHPICDPSLCPDAECIVEPLA
jgi:hypothetical protein